MTNQYGRRGGADTDRAPSGGSLSTPIRRPASVSGVGKLLAGTHDLEVLAVTDRASHFTLILADPADHCHTDDVVGPVPAWCRPGARVRATLGYNPGGWVLLRDGARYRAADPTDWRPLTDWRQTAYEVWTQCNALRLQPAYPAVKELRCGDLPPWLPVLHSPQAGGPAAPAAPDAGGAG